MYFPEKIFHGGTSLRFSSFLQPCSAVGLCRHTCFVCDIFILKIIIGVGVIFGLFYSFIPFVMDIGNIMNQNYYVVEGKVESWNYSDEGNIEERGVGILCSETGKEIFVVIYDTGVRKGEYLRVRYLPHTKQGEIMYRREMKNE